MASEQRSAVAEVFSETKEKGLRSRVISAEARTVTPREVIQRNFKKSILIFTRMLYIL